MVRLMKIYVCVKHVPDSAATITVKGETEIEEGITFLMNPYDEHAVTEARRLKEIFPESIRSRNVHVHLFDGYWEDIGTIGSFYRCNLELAGAEPPFDFVSTEAPIYTRSRYLPPSRLGGATVRNSIIADGCIIGSTCYANGSTSNCDTCDSTPSTTSCRLHVERLPPSET